MKDLKNDKSRTMYSTTKKTNREGEKNDAHLGGIVNKGVQRAALGNLGV